MYWEAQCAITLLMLLQHIHFKKSLSPKNLFYVHSCLHCHQIKRWKEILSCTFHEIHFWELFVQSIHFEMFIILCTHKYLPRSETDIIFDVFTTSFGYVFCSISHDFQRYLINKVLNKTVLAIYGLSPLSLLCMYCITSMENTMSVLIWH